MTHDDALKIQNSLRKTEEKPLRKPRMQTVLPISIQISDDPDESLVIADLSLEKLIDMRTTLKSQLADMPRLELELKSVVKEIGRKAKV